MRVVQRARKKERGRPVVLVAVVVVIEDKQPMLHHLGCLQVSYSNNNSVLPNTWLEVA